MIQSLWQFYPWKTEGNILVIGGGPIGLFTSALLKAENPCTDVHVYEKYRTYQRRHVVQIRHDSLKGAPDHPVINQVIEKIKAAKPRGWIWKTSSISTSELEGILLEAAKSLGVKVYAGYHIRKPQDVAKFHRNPRFILGADGAHSTTRKTIFGDQLQNQKNLNSIAEIKYFVKGQTSRISIKSHYAGCKKVGTTVTEHVGKMNSAGYTPVTIRMIISDDDHEALQNATFKNPYRMSQCPEKVRQAFESWKQRRFRLKGDEIIEGSEKVSALVLSNYASKNIVKKVQGITYALFGDSAVGVPFFSSLNFGLRCAIAGAKCISNAFEDPTDLNIKEYESFVLKKARWVLTLAKIKSFGIKCFNFFFHWSQLSPFQLIK